mgnify:CR=1 FL=1
MGSDEALPYQENTLDFVINSCVIQHLHSFDEVCKAFKEIQRVLKKGGEFFLVFKCGNHDSEITHFNPHYGYNRTFRVYDHGKVKDYLESIGFEIKQEDKAVDQLYLPYSFFVVKKL